MCLDNVVNTYDENGESFRKLKGLIPKELLSRLKHVKHVQNNTVNLKINNWNNHSFCLGKIKNFSINKPLSEILEFINARTPSYVWKTVYVDDLEWNREHTTPMWKTASKEKNLSEYGFKPAENVTVMVDRI